MRRASLLTAAAAGAAAWILMAALQPRAIAHCEVPCGIYDDPARVAQLLEDATTIGKAVGEITALAGKTDAQSINQVVRWVNTKEAHATHIQETIAQYFLDQRVKPAARGSDGWNDYVNRLTDHHAVMVAAMQCKQAVDPARTAALRAAIEKIAAYYPAPKPAADGHGH